MTIETLLNLHAKDSEQLLVNNIVKLKAKNKSHSLSNPLFLIIKHFYFMNDIRINKEKIGKFMVESQRKNSDMAHKYEEIKKIFDVADVRM